MADARTSGYADGLFQIAKAEGVLETVEDELFRFARSLEGELKLRDALVDPGLPVEQRSKLVAELLGTKASPHTVNIIRFVVEQGRARELPAIIDEMVKHAASERNLAVAEVRAAVPLVDEQRTALVAALEKATGRKIELKVLVDPSVVGGFVARVGDVVFDASIRRRLQGLREKIGSR